MRGDVTVDLGRKLPSDLSVSYMNEHKSGVRGASGGDTGVVTTAVDVPEPMDEITQDFGVRWAYNHKGGNLYASFNRNMYNDRIDSLVVDNPFRATDAAYVSTSVPGGPSRARFSTSPDNEGNRGAVGALFKFKRQTRITADMAFNRWTQNAQFLPFTINTAIVTPTGASAASAAILPRQSLDGKIHTTSLNFGFASRPFEGPEHPAAVPQLRPHEQDDADLAARRQHVRFARSVVGGPKGRPKRRRTATRPRTCMTTRPGGSTRRSATTSRT